MSMASNRHISMTDVDKRSTEAQLRSKVKELEDEVSSLKKRLDDLRRAKNTTFLKREREIVHVSAPFGRRDTSQKTDASKNEMEELRKKFAEEVEILKKQNEEMTKCDHESELELLRRQLREVEGDNSALRLENQDLRERVESLATQLSVKEAKWCETEEKMKIELQRSWGEKYREWMAATESKITELQQTNALLRGYLKNQQPRGSDPTGQDKDVS